MNKLKMIGLIVLFIGLNPTMSYAAANAWTSWYPVSQVYVYSDGSYFVSLSPWTAHSNPAGCTSSSWMRLMPDQINAKDVYKMALTAQASGLKVNAYIDGNSCAGSYPKLLRIRTVAQ